MYQPTQRREQAPYRPMPVPQGNIGQSLMGLGAGALLRPRTQEAGAPSITRKSSTVEPTLGQALEALAPPPALMSPAYGPGPDPIQDIAAHGAQLPWWKMLGQGVSPMTGPAFGAWPGDFSPMPQFFGGV